MRARTSSRTRSGGNERSTLDRWLEHIEKKFVARTKRDGKPSLTHTGDRTIILVTICSRTVNADTTGEADRVQVRAETVVDTAHVMTSSIFVLPHNSRFEDTVRHDE